MDGGEGQGTDVDVESPPAAVAAGAGADAGVCTSVAGARPPGCGSAGQSAGPASGGSGVGAEGGGDGGPRPVTRLNTRETPAPAAETAARVCQKADRSRLDPLPPPPPLAPVGGLYVLFAVGSAPVRMPVHSTNSS
jgi:hypothetical protein